MEVIIKISAREVREIADLIEARRDRPNADELANRIKNRLLSAKFIPEKNSSESSGSSPEQTRTNVDLLEV